MCLYGNLFRLGTNRTILRRSRRDSVLSVRTMFSISSYAYILVSTSYSELYRSSESSITSKIRWFWYWLIFGKSRKKVKIRPGNVIYQKTAEKLVLTTSEVGKKSLGADSGGEDNSRHFSTLSSFSVFCGIGHMTPNIFFHAHSLYYLNPCVSLVF